MRFSSPLQHCGCNCCGLQGILSTVQEVQTELTPSPTLSTTSTLLCTILCAQLTTSTFQTQFQLCTTNTTTALHSGRCDVCIANAEGENPDGTFAKQLVTLQKSKALLIATCTLLQWHGGISLHSLPGLYLEGK